MGDVLQFPGAPTPRAQPPTLTCTECGCSWFNALVSLDAHLGLNELATTNISCAMCAHVLEFT